MYFRQFIQNIQVQLDKKAKYYKVPLLKKGMATIIANDLLEQVRNYSGHEMYDLKTKRISVPVNFRYGLFALQYIRKKYQIKQSEKQLLTFR